MGIIFVTLWLAAMATAALYYRRPRRARARSVLATVYLFTTYRPRHTEPADPGGQRAMARWDAAIVGVDVCARCAAPMREGACPRCEWTRPEPPQTAPFEPVPDPDGLVFPGPEATARGWLSGAMVPDWAPPGGAERPAEPPAAGDGPTQAVERTDGATEPPGAWRAAYDELAPPPVGPFPLRVERRAFAPPPCPECGCRGRHGLPHPASGPPSCPGAELDPERLEPPPPEPELPPGGDWAPGTGPPEDGDTDGPGGGPWADAEHARELAAQDADAAEFIDAMDRERRRYLWQLRRGFLAQQGLAI